ncbi:hypothetical protein SO694_00143050 [Aureococcus anophagefferens]|uniref:TNFR-Cys domain-containing protein n=1 Tax=Aureococcus anophagefferens TaxID=44056 RepID=A0ABR1FPJ4_AURAN
MKRNALLLLALAVVAKAGSSGAVSAGGDSFDSACTDSTTWHKKGDDEKNCAWVGKKAAKRCTAKVKSEDGVLASGWKKSKSCAWVGKSPAKRCDKESKSKVLASDACPVACDACPTWAEVIAELEAANAALEGKVAELEAKLEAPTPAPTVDPTASPMTAPTATPTAAPMAFTCAADEYFDGCSECPNGYTCDGVTKTCAVNKYVDNNECLECPASAKCDGVNACDDVNKYVDENNECLECPTGFATASTRRSLRRT